MALSQGANINYEFTVSVVYSIILQVRGLDSSGYEFQRSTHTAISPITPDPPVVTMEKVTQGYYDKTVLLHCDVSSLVPFEVQWYRDGEEMGTKLFYRSDWATQEGNRKVQYFLKDHLFFYKYGLSRFRL